MLQKMDGTFDNKKFLTAQELVERYEGRITARTLANWRSNGTSPPFCKVGGRILYPISDLIAWENSRTVIGTNQYKK